VADRWSASSTTCSGCGAVNATLALSERTYRCDVRGTVAGGDVNAARRLAKYSQNELRVVASGAQTRNGREADRQTGPARQEAVKRQPGTAPADRTETVLSPDGTAA